MVAIFATMTFALTACGNDDDEPSNANIIGTWKEMDDTYLEEHYVQFNSDKNYYEVSIDEDGININRGTWKLDGNSIVIHSTDLDMDFSAEINKVSSNELEVTMWGIRQTYKKVADSEIEKYL